MRGVVGRRVLADLKMSKAHLEGVLEAEKEGDKEVEKEAEFIISDDDEDIPSAVIVMPFQDMSTKESVTLPEEDIAMKKNVTSLEDEGERDQNEGEEEGEKKPIRRKTAPVTSSSIIVTPRYLLLLVC
jgi:hypothetical protein